MDNDKIIEALEAGKYNISFKEPNNIELCTKYDGSVFFKIVGDNVKFSVSGGFCIVEVLGKRFECDLTNGDWSDENENELDDKLIETLEDTEGVISGEYMEPDEEWEIYCKATGTDKTLPYFWHEDEDCPLDIRSLGFSDFTIPCHCNELFDNKTISKSFEVDSTINDSDLYEIYKYLVKNGCDFSDKNEEIEVTDEMLGMHLPSIFQSIIKQVRKIACNQGHEGKLLRFKFMINHDFLEATLGSNPYSDNCI